MKLIVKAGGRGSTETSGRRERRRVPEPASGVLPITPREHLEWLFDAFVYSDLAAINESGITRLDFALRTMPVASSPYAFILPRHLSKDVLRNIQSVLRSAFEALAEHRAYQRDLTSVRVTAEFVQPLRRVRGIDHVLAHSFSASPPDVVLLVALELLRNTRASLLRRCLYKKRGAGRECGRVFIARKRQKWCSEHQPLVRREQNQIAQEKYKRLRASRNRTPRKGRPKPTNASGGRRNGE